MATHYATSRVKVWDLPTRLFHWALVGCVIGLVVAAYVGGNAMVWHFRFGYLMATLLAFRLVWGFVGGRWSRFSAFLYSPRHLVAYLKSPAAVGDSTGHSPAGALSVFALLGFLLAQVATGMLSDDEIAFAGPLSRFFSNATVGLATGYHTNVGKFVLLALVLLHIGAVAYYQWRNHRLIDAMIHGDKELPLPVAPSRDDALTRCLALIIFLACAAGAWWISSLAY